MNSFNHYWLGCVSEWLITRAAGIDTDGPGFKRIIVRPELGAAERGFSWVKAKYQSMRGPVTSNWRREGTRLDLDVSIPANTTAKVYVPASDATRVTESGKPVARVAGIKFLGLQDGCVVLEVGSGRYQFTSTAAAVR